MNKKTKNLLKVGVVALALLLCLSLAIGLTGAWYKASRTASGTLALNQGIIIDYQGFGSTEGIWEKGTTFKLFSTDEVAGLPGKEITLNSSAIRANTGSVDFYARVKLTYEFLDAAGQPVTGVDATSIFKSINIFNTEKWVDGGSKEGWFYLGHDTTLDVFTKTNTDYTSIFASGAKLVVDDAITGEGPGVTINDKTITKINILLTLETLQGSATSEQAASLGWEILVPPVIEDFSVNYLGNVSGNKIYTLAEGQDVELSETTGGYCVINPETNIGYAFMCKLNEGEKEIQIVQLIGEPTEVVVPDYLRVNNVDYKVTSIYPFAFAYKQTLTSIKLSNTLEEIGVAAFAYTGITSITIPKNVVRIGEEVILGGDKFVGTVFAGCENFESIYVDGENQKFYTPDNKNLIERTSEEVSTLVAVASWTEEVYTTPNKVTNLRGGFWSTVSQISTFIISDNVKVIEGAFGGAFDSLVIGNQIAAIGKGTFNSHGGSSINKIYINDLKFWCEAEFEDYPFNNNSRCDIYLNNELMEDFIVPENTSRINLSAFSGTKIKSFIVPDNLNIEITGRMSYCENLTKIKIGDGIENIDFRFSDCNSITEIELGRDVKTLTSDNFSTSKGITLTIFAEVPPTGIGLRVPTEDFEYERDYYSAIFVPDDSVSVYQSAEGWSKYAGKIKPVSEKQPAA